MKISMCRLAGDFAKGALGAFLALALYTGGFSGGLEDPRSVCLYAALEEAPEVIPHLDPAEKIYGHVEACDGLSTEDQDHISRLFRDAMTAAVTR